MPQDIAPEGEDTVPEDYLFEASGITSTLFRDFSPLPSAATLDILRQSLNMVTFVSVAILSLAFVHVTNTFFADIIKTPFEELVNKLRHSVIKEAKEIFSSIPCDNDASISMVDDGMCYVSLLYLSPLDVFILCIP